MQTVNGFLLCVTPEAWIEQALANQDLLLIDHANCEKKAASTAINLMYRYVENYELLNKMSRLAREQVIRFAGVGRRDIEIPRLEALDRFVDGSLALQ